MTTRMITGDCREVLKTIASESIQCCVTSPPYMGLRDYGTATWEGGDPECQHRVGGQVQDSKAVGAITSGVRPGCDASKCKLCGARRVDQQIGLESSPQAYVDELVKVFREVRRVLRKDGTVWLNLGDSYANDGKWGGSSGGKHVRELHGDTRIGRGKQSTGLKPKDLMMIPARVAIALQDDGWWLRQEIIWHKPNPMPESVEDRCTRAHEQVFMLTKAARYFYDAQAIAEPFTGHPTGPGGTFDAKDPVTHNPDRGDGGRTIGRSDTTGRNARSVWTIATQPYAGAHFATMPPTLAERCIKAGTSERGQCPGCGAPWVRATDRIASGGIFGSADGRDGELRNDSAKRAGRVGEVSSITTGWSPSCNCPEHMPVPQTVLDPFAGSGTTLLVADRLQRHGIGIDLNPEYAASAKDRVYGDAPLLADVA